MLTQIHVSGYRSVRDLDLSLGRLNVLTGPNGCGKSNLYNSLVLVARAAKGELARAVAEEGGMPSLFWAGRRIRTTRKAPKRVTLSVSSEFGGYELQFGLVPTMPGSPTMFSLDPDVKEEAIWPPSKNQRPLMLERQGMSAWLRNDAGRMVAYPLSLQPSESILAQVIEPHLYPEASRFRAEILGWRFYHQFRTDAASPLRQPQIGVRTPVLNADGTDLAAALRTIVEVGDHQALTEAISEAFAGAVLSIDNQATLFSARLSIPGLLRPLDTRELSDGQLRFLCLCAALLSPRPPTLLGLNEPETSLHPALVGPLARLIVRAAENTQLWITTHSQGLVEKVEEYSRSSSIRLRLRNGATEVEDSGGAADSRTLGPAAGAPEHPTRGSRGLGALGHPNSKARSSEN